MSLSVRFGEFKKYINQLNLVHGNYWEEAKKTFDITFDEKGYKNLGTRDYFPEILNKNDDLKNYQIVNVKTNLKIIKIGNNSFGVKKKDYKNDTLIYSIKYQNLISDLINENDLVCEVGAGSGILTALSHSEKKTRNIIIDIPNVLLCSISFLFTIFPNKKFLLPNEINSSLKNFDYDFIFLTPNQKNLIEDESIDLGINTFSFMEMNYKELEEYFIFFQKKIKNKKFFFTTNRIRKVNKFFKYPFNLFYDFKKIYIRRDEYFYKKGTTVIQLIMQKDKEKKFNFVNLDLFYKHFNVYLYYPKEFFFWLKKDIISFVHKFIKVFKK